MHPPLMRHSTIHGALAPLLILSLAMSVAVEVRGTAIPYVSDREAGSNVGMIRETEGGSAFKNMVVEFHSAGKTLWNDEANISAKGGTVRIKGEEVKVAPWKYVTTNWTVGKVWVIFLANVTVDNFKIMFLYVMNSTNQFLLRVFDYATGTFDLYQFKGSSYVNDRLVETKVTAIPKLSIKPQAKNQNSFSVIGEDLYTTEREGLLVNGTEYLRVYPIYNQFGEGKEDYNELWAILVDSKERLYFSILYLLNADPNRVIMGHTIRLNDYSALPGRNLKSRWIKGSFPNRLSIGGVPQESTIAVDGFPFHPVESGRVNVLVPPGTITVEAETFVPMRKDARLRFDRWSTGQSSPRIEINIRENADISMHYKKQYSVSVLSPHGEPTGGGWYDEGSRVEIGVSARVEYSNNTRYLFASWTGDAEGPKPRTLVTVDGPKTAVANWDTEYALAYQTSGLPDEVKVLLLIDGSEHTVDSGRPLKMWIPQARAVNVTISETKIILRGDLYEFQGWKNTKGSGSSVTLTVNQPIVIEAVFQLTRTFTSKITLTASPSTVTFDPWVELAGSTDPHHKDVQVNLRMKTEGGSWQQLGTARTKSDGRFVMRWTPTFVGRILFQAEWGGDNDHKGSTSSEVEVVNAEYMASIREAVGSLHEKIRVAGQSNRLVGQTVEVASLPVSMVAETLASTNMPLPADHYLSLHMRLAVLGALLGLIYLAPVFTMVAALRRKRLFRARALTIPLALLVLGIIPFILSSALSLNPPTMLLSGGIILYAIANILFAPLLLGIVVGRIMAR